MTGSFAFNYSPHLRFGGLAVRRMVKRIQAIADLNSRRNWLELVASARLCVARNARAVHWVVSRNTAQRVLTHASLAQPEIPVAAPVIAVFGHVGLTR